MTEFIHSWPWYDRLWFVFILLMFLSIPVLLSGVSRQLDRIIRLLEIGNDINNERRPRR